MAGLLGYVRISVMHGDSDPGVALLSPDTVRGGGGDEISLHPLEEDCRTNVFLVFSLHTSDPSGAMGLMDNGGLAICPRTLGSRFPMGGGVMTCYASCISPVWGIQWTCLLWAGWIGRDGITGRGLSGTQELWVYLAYACVMTVSV